MIHPLFLTISMKKKKFNEEIKISMKKSEFHLKHILSLNIVSPASGLTKQLQEAYQILLDSYKVRICLALQTRSKKVKR